jgi:hypothetical protein
MTSVDSMLRKSKLIGISYIDNAYFGNSPITKEDLKAITYNGDGLTRTMLPVKQQGANFIPNFELLNNQNFVKANREINKLL